jgi:GNAT superfamily N-acetyltransferase
MGMKITQAAPADAEEILDLQKLAYQSEAAIYQDYTIAPLTQTSAEIAAEFHTRHFLKAVADGCIRGSVRAHQEQGTCYIGRLIVHPAYQNQGLGAKLMDEIEGCFPEARRYELFTGYLSERNLDLYRKLGYVPIRRAPVSEKLTLVFLEKRGNSRTSRGLLAERNQAAGVR